MGWLTSTQPILNSLLGGVGTFWGPVVGTFAYAVLTYSTRTIVGLSEVLIGGCLLLLGQVAARVPARRRLHEAVGRS